MTHEARDSDEAPKSHWFAMVCVTPLWARMFWNSSRFNMETASCFQAGATISARPPICMNNLNASAVRTASKLCRRFLLCCSTVAVFNPYLSPPETPRMDEGSPCGVRWLMKVDFGGTATIAWNLSPAMSPFSFFHTSSSATSCWEPCLRSTLWTFHPRFSARFAMLDVFVEPLNKRRIENLAAGAVVGGGTTIAGVLSCGGLTRELRVATTGNISIVRGGVSGVHEFQVAAVDACCESVRARCRGGPELWLSSATVEVDGGSGQGGSGTGGSIETGVCESTVSTGVEADGEHSSPTPVSQRALPRPFFGAGVFVQSLPACPLSRHLLHWCLLFGSFGHGPPFPAHFPFWYAPQSEKPGLFVVYTPFSIFADPPFGFLGSRTRRFWLPLVVRLRVRLLSSFSFAFREAWLSVLAWHVFPGGGGDTGVTIDVV